jgi:dienelactone hydrolase
VDFALEVLHEEDRGDYVQQKITFAVSPWYRVPAYLLLPKVPGPCPAIVNLHDHGAFFLYGKEKVVATAADHNPGLKSFKETCYGGRSTAHELARRGYVVLVIDGLFWGERASRGFGEERFDLNTVEGVQAWNAAAYQTAGSTSANLLNAGLSWCSILLRDDLRSAEFLASLPAVDARRIGCCGLSMGCFRSWHLAALSDLIQASVNICWMTDIKTQLLERCNLSTSIGAMSMIIPGIMRYLDYADFASLICPRPALFFNGRRDGLFPIPSVERAYATMRKVWDSQGVGDRLHVRLWDVPHEFNAEMQEEAFAWLDRWLKP